MKNRTNTFVLFILLFSVLAGCAVQEKATYDISRLGDLGNLSVLDARVKENPMGIQGLVDPRRRYLSENALGPSLISIFKNQLAPAGKSLSNPSVVEVRGIEISLIPVDNSMGGNSNDPGVNPDMHIFVPDVGMVAIPFGPSSNKSLVSVRSILRVAINGKSYEFTEFGMSTHAKLEPEIQKVYYKAIDSVANEL